MGSRRSCRDRMTGNRPIVFQRGCDDANVREANALADSYILQCSRDNDTMMTTLLRRSGGEASDLNEVPAITA